MQLLICLYLTVFVIKRKEKLGILSFPWNTFDIWTTKKVVVPGSRLLFFDIKKTVGEIKPAEIFSYYTEQLQWVAG